MIRIALINPNTSSLTTARMTAIASEAAGAAVTFEGFTAAAGPTIVADEQALEVAAQLVIARGSELSEADYQGILISGFGDPGLDRLRGATKIPVTGIAEAGMAEAARDGRRFTIVTTTPLLKAAIASRAWRLGHGDNLLAVRIAGSVEVMQDAPRLERALLECCEEAVMHDGAEAILVGGGPLADAARAIAPLVSVPVIEPVSAGARLAKNRAEATENTPRPIYRT